jgi:hypothetical protein
MRIQIPVSLWRHEDFPLFVFGSIRYKNNLDFFIISLLLNSDPHPGMRIQDNQINEIHATPDSKHRIRSCETIENTT